MSFTDDDLKRLKGCLRKEHGFNRECFGDAPEDYLSALLARLHAAEAIVRWAGGIAPVLLMERWVASKETSNATVK